MRYYIYPKLTGQGRAGTWDEAKVGGDVGAGTVKAW